MSACDTTPITSPASSTTGNALTRAFRIRTIISLNDAVFFTATTRVVITSLTMFFIASHLLATSIVWRMRLGPSRVNGAASPAPWPPHQGPKSHRVRHMQRRQMRQGRAGGRSPGECAGEQAAGSGGDGLAALRHDGSTGRFERAP